MTISEAEKFYSKDTKEYELVRNNEFLSWLKTIIDDGYHSFITIEKLQNLIDYITRWYEIKYPERELGFYEGIRYTNFQNIRRISNVMNIDQLLFRLPFTELCLMECRYRANSLCQYPIYGNDKIEGDSQAVIKVNKKNYHHLVDTPYIFIYANSTTGKVVKDYDLNEYLDCDEDIYLKDLLDIFDKNYSDKIDYKELKEVIYNHICDIELRNRILQLVALKLLYSRTTTPERGYERAKRFINEFNKKMGLSLSTLAIDNALIDEDNIDENKKSKTLTKSLFK